jgi:hypothetical protein
VCSDRCGPWRCARLPGTYRLAHEILDRPTEERLVPRPAVGEHSDAVGVPGGTVTLVQIAAGHHGRVVTDMERHPQTHTP